MHRWTSGWQPVCWECESNLAHHTVPGHSSHKAAHWRCPWVVFHPHGRWSGQGFELGWPKPMTHLHPSCFQSLVITYNLVLNTCMMDHHVLCHSMDPALVLFQQVKVVSFDLIGDKVSLKSLPFLEPVYWEVGRWGWWSPRCPDNLAQMSQRRFGQCGDRRLGGYLRWRLDELGAWCWLAGVSN